MIDPRLLPATAPPIDWLHVRPYTEPTMRKRLKRKKHSCAMCKSYKMGGENRWKPKEFEKLVRAEKEIRHASRED
jgi:hypothetical protein